MTASNVATPETRSASPLPAALRALFRGTGYAVGFLLLMTVTFLALRIPPGPAFAAIWQGAIGDAHSGHWDPISETLMETIPLLLTGLSVVVAWRAGLFSIGAEGQLLMGALAAVAVGGAIGGLNPDVARPLLLVVGAGAGALWGALAGWLRVRRNVQEVIGTIMLNYVALNIVGWLALGPLHGKTQSGPYTDPLAPALMFGRIVPVAWTGFQTRLHSGVFLAFCAMPLVAILMTRTTTGYGLRLIGENAEAARIARYPVDRLRMQAMAISGALCGLAGAIELLHDTGRVGRDFSPGWGYTAIPVALLGGLSPLGTLFSALFFGALAAGTANAQRTPGIGVPSVVSYIVQAATVLAIVGLRAWRQRATAVETQ